MNSEHKQYDGEMAIDSQDLNAFNENDFLTNQQENLPDDQTDLLSDQEDVQQLTDGDMEQTSGGFIRGAMVGFVKGGELYRQEAKTEGAGFMEQGKAWAKGAAVTAGFGLLHGKGYVDYLVNAAKTGAY